MAERPELLSAGRRAADVLAAVNAKGRMDAGYTRVDPFAVAALDGVPVLARPLDRLLGAFLREEQPGILVNSARPVGLVHMTCAHELGHYFLGHSTTTDAHIDYGNGADMQERQADWFAYALLTPRWLVSKLMQRKGWTVGSFQDAVAIYQLSLRLGISFSGAVWQLQRHNILSLASARGLSQIPPEKIKRSLSPMPLDDVANQDVWLLDSRDQDMILEPRENDKFVMQLPSRVSAGYLWSLDEAAREGFELRPLLVDGSSPITPSAEGVQIGGTRSAAYQLERSKPIEADTAHLRFRESQPWRPRENQDPTFALATKFEVLSEGLTRASRERLVQEVASE